MPVTSNHQNPIGEPVSQEKFDKEYYEELKRHIRKTLLQEKCHEYMHDKKAGWVVTPLQQGLAARVGYRRLYGDGIPEQARGKLVLQALQGYSSALVREGYSVTPIIRDRAVSLYDFAKISPYDLDEIHPYLLVISL